MKSKKEILQSVGDKSSFKRYSPCRSEKIRKQKINSSYEVSYLPRRTVENDKLERINALTRGDLAYIIRKFNIDKRRHDDDMVEKALKVKEWNSEGKNDVFLFEQIGEAYVRLKDEDFALGYMNDNMERKLKRFQKNYMHRWDTWKQYQCKKL
ncbi:uncharacterized protein LOC123681030 [Harmonia axyridis]|uniref:uncharacterized protein LOC123681030 n=1 Tax=Harmonia axyridis TaxID=115357 RepID=UPI001E279961|nr:uncharacterized protein LOC123681030 [Harmonia axyridis]